MEDMEDRLKADILAESELYGGHILVTDETDIFTTFNLMVQVSPESVNTPKEVFHELLEEGYNLVYNRIPITDEKVRCPWTAHHAWYEGQRTMHYLVS
jgi:sulfatase maturation enzyme AslB (radical SAM superfamily)